MKRLGLTLSALLIAGPLAFAQAPGTPASKSDPAPAATDPDAAAKAAKNQEFLDKYLEAWEQRMRSVSALETKIILTEVADGSKTVYTGEASLMKPNFAKMLIKEQANPGNTKKWRHIVADGNIDDKGRGPYLWEYDYSKKIARVTQMPKNGIGDNPMMGFLFGPKAADLKKRYVLSIDVYDEKKHNDFYLHIAIRPKLKEDMQEFDRAELVLWKNNKDPKYADVWMLPARLWFQNPNGDQITWQFESMTTQKKFLPRDFKAPGFPDKDWKSEWTQPPKPTVSRTVAPAK
jgi:TIGR03009 family protein